VPKFSMLWAFGESGVPLALEQAEKKEDGGDSTSGGVNTGQASYGREFPRPVLREPRARLLGGRVHPFTDRARGTLAALPEALTRLGESLDKRISRASLGPNKGMNERRSSHDGPYRRAAAIRAREAVIASVLVGFSAWKFRRQMS
jgi:hypothetical protein